MRAKEPFVFMDYEGLIMPTGLRATNLREFFEHLRRLPLEVLYHHLHRTALNHRFAVWDYPNDLAQWAARSLEDRALAEKLAAIDLHPGDDLERVRVAILDLIEEHLDQTPTVPWARPGFEFHFASGHFIALPGEREAWSLEELRRGVAEVPLSSIFYHFHETRFRHQGEDVDDFTRWIEAQYGADPIASHLRGIDYAFFALDDLRERILSVFDEHLAGRPHERPAR